MWSNYAPMEVEANISQSVISGNPSLSDETRLSYYFGSTGAVQAIQSSIFGSFPGWVEGGGGYHNLFIGLLKGFGLISLFAYLLVAGWSLIRLFGLSSKLLSVMLLVILPNCFNVPASQPVYIICVCVCLLTLRSIDSEPRNDSRNS